MTGETTIPEKKLGVASYVNHEDYGKPNRFSNDITVIELAEELDLTVYIPACLAQTGDATAFDGEDRALATFFLGVSKLSSLSLRYVKSLSGHTESGIHQDRRT